MTKKILAERGCYTQKKEIVKQLNTHPFYPSLESILDTLNNYSLDLKAFQVEPHEIGQAVEHGCIAHLKKDNEGIIYLNHDQNGQIVLRNLIGQKKKILLQDLTEIVSGIVIPLADSPIRSKANYTWA